MTRIAAILFFLATTASAQTNDPSPGTYRYDGAGNIKAIGANRYVFDGVSRLRQGTAITQAQQNAETYVYDAFGNLRTTTTDGSPAQVFAVAISAATNRAENAAACPPQSTCFLGTFDEAGNQLTFGSTMYDYDSNRMVQELKSSGHDQIYLYDADDQRTVTVDYGGPASQTWHYTLRNNGAQVVRDLDDVLTGSAHAISWKKDYVDRGAFSLASIAPASDGERILHFHLDHLGTLRLLTGSGARRISAHMYWPYGREAVGSDSDDEVMRFAGQERDRNGDGNDLDYMHARYYSGTAGRFLSLDPERRSVDPRIPQSWNRFSYALDNPVRYSDPDGRCVGALPCPTWLVVGAEATGTQAVTQVGSRAVGGVAGPIGVMVASAAVTGWQIGREIGTSTIGGRTIDSRVTDLFEKAIDNIHQAENTQHGEDRENDPDREVDRDKVKAHGDVYVDTETGATVYVHGGQVVLENEEGGLISQWNDQTEKETRQKVKEGKWRKKPKDQDEPEIQ